MKTKTEDSKARGEGSAAETSKMDQSEQQCDRTVTETEVDKHSNSSEANQASTPGGITASYKYVEEGKEEEEAEDGLAIVPQTTLRRNTDLQRSASSPVGAHPVAGMSSLVPPELDEPRVVVNHDALSREENNESTEQRLDNVETVRMVENGPLVEATLVEEDANNRLENSNQMIVEAKPVTDEDDRSRHITKLMLFVLALSIIVALTITAVVVTRGSINNNPDSTPQVANDTQDEIVEVDAPPTLSTLQRIRQRGFLRCGIPQEDDTQNYRFPNTTAADTFDGAMCRAIAAAALGPNYKVEYIEIFAVNRSAMITNVTLDIDMLVHGYQLFMDRDLFSTTDWDDYGPGLTGSTPYLYLEHSYGGNLHFVTCAENANYYNDCSDLVICMVEGVQSILDESGSLFPRQNTVPVSGIAGLLNGYLRGDCNVMLYVKIVLEILQSQLSADALGNGFVIGNLTSRRLPLHLNIITRDGDPQWSDFCNYVLQAMIAAERYGITKDNIVSVFDDESLLENPDLPRFVGDSPFGEDYKDMFYHAIKAAGNYDEAMSTFKVPRGSMNWPVSSNEFGIIKSYGFGNYLDRNGPEPNPSGRLRAIMDSNRLRCVVQIAKPGFADRIYSNQTDATTNLQGLDVEYCRALAASLFSTDVGTLEFLEVRSEAEGFQLLHSGAADVFAGPTLNLERDVREPTTGVGFAFSRPYFYNNSADILYRIDGANRCLATPDEDQEWSSYVFWVVEAIVHAEENGINQTAPNEMPAVYLFGSQLTRMFRDVINVVGNYGEIYSRTLEKHIPRAGLNRLYLQQEHFGPLLQARPGLFAA